MARAKRFCPSGIPQHVVQRGNNRQRCFFDAQDKATYYNYLVEFAIEFSVQVHAWVLMDNHVHLLMTPKKDNAISQLMQAQGRRYVRYFNHLHKRSGTLWEGRFRSCLVDSEAYLLQCQRYIEHNPVRAHMVEHPGSYRWSSYPCHAWGASAELHSPHALYLGLGESAEARCGAYRELSALPLSESDARYIRNACNAGLALGSDQFLKDMEARGGRRLVPASIGRPKSR